MKRVMRCAAVFEWEGGEYMARLYDDGAITINTSEGYPGPINSTMTEQMEFLLRTLRGVRGK